jgi:hypothetical protein
MNTGSSLQRPALQYDGQVDAEHPQRHLLLATQCRT